MNAAILRVKPQPIAALMAGLDGFMNNPATKDFPSMRLFRWFLWSAMFITFGVACYQTTLWLGVWGSFGDSQVRPLDEKDQEVALIEPATSIDDWGRIVTALKLLERDWPKINPHLPALQLNLDEAFPKLSAEVPEIVMSMGAAPGQRLRLRWYKISGEHDAASWVKKLHARKRLPLAIVGGATSDRAVRLANALAAIHPVAADPAPVFLITTATAEKTAENSLLIDAYRERSFRFSFTNKRMVESLLKFVQQTPNLWVHKTADAQQLLFAVASMAGAGDAWQTCAIASHYPALQNPQYSITRVVWEDERYSQDLAELFGEEFKTRFPGGKDYDAGRISYSIGDFFQPAPLEQATVQTFITDRSPVGPHSLLVLPTQTIRMRRFLINLRERSPLDARNLVILNGDAISFNSVYRDRDVVWNILNLPYSVVFFSHRNPIDRDAGFSTKIDLERPSNVFPQRTTTGTNDILLYRDVFEAFLYAAFDQGDLLGDSLAVRQRLRATAWHYPQGERAKTDRARICNTRVHALEPEPRRFFSISGNRRSYTGEHIVWIRPYFADDVVLATSTISVWSASPDANGNIWEIVVPSPFHATYNQK